MGVSLQYRQILNLVEARQRLWAEFVANYQREMIERPESFSEYCEKFRERFARGF